MKIKEIKRTANVAWSPSFQHPIYLAAATAAQQLDSSFSTNACLELFRLDFEDTEIDPKTYGSITTNDRLHKLVWSPGVRNSSNDSNLPDFLIGGAEQGRLYIWNPKNILCKKEEPLVYLLDKHVGAVCALDVNPFQVNLLASGAGNSEIFIWDLSNPDKPMTPGSKAQPAQDVICVAWNKQVQHILGSSQDGNCIVWDLRKNEPIIQIRDSMSKMKCSLACWHPDVATQLCIASEDDHTPAVQLWDLRSATSPVKQFEGHNRGILSLAWCPQDSGLLLSCGKDNRILCWNPNSDRRAGEIVYELPNTNQWCFDVQWCPRNPGIISGCSFDGNVSIYSITQGSQQTTNNVVDMFGTNDDTSYHITSLKSAPKWLKRPCGASFGFGGKLVTFTNSKVSANCEQWSSQVRLSQVVTEPLLVMRSIELEEALNSNNLITFCNKKVSDIDGSGEGRNGRNDVDVWNFLKTSLEAGSQEKYLKLLDNDGVVDEGDGAGISNVIKDDFEDLSLADNTAMKDSKQIQFGHEELIRKALLRANFQEAVSVCIKNEFLTEALILAHAGGQKLFLSTQQEILKNKNSRLHKLISFITNHDIESIVSSYDISKWREVLLIILTYAFPKEFASLCNLLGKRLEETGNPLISTEAQLCYIMAGNIEQLVSNLEKNMDSNCHHKLQNVIEKVTVLQNSQQNGNTKNSVWHGSLLTQRLTEYAEILAEQGCAVLTLRYLESLHDLKSAILKDRAYCSLGREFASMYEQPRKPFEVIDIKPHLITQKPANYNPQCSSLYHQPGPLKDHYQAHQKIPTNQTPATFSNLRHPTNSLSQQQSFYLNHNSQTYDSNILNPSTDMQRQIIPPHGQYYSHPSHIADSLYNPALANQSSSLDQNLPSVYGQSKPPAWNDPPLLNDNSSQGASASSGQSYQRTLYNPHDFIAEQPHVPPPPLHMAEVEAQNHYDLPREQKFIKEVFDATIQECYGRATNMLTRKKLDDICKKLEVLYRRLCEGSLSPTISAGIQQIVSCMQQLDYNMALAHHTQIASMGNFSEISSFFPSIKILLHTAIQLKVYMQ